MRSNDIFLGIDLGSSGVKIAIIKSNKELIYFEEMNYLSGLESINNWSKCCEKLIQNIPISLKKNISACSVDGTSGTLLACDRNGTPYGQALPFNIIFNEYKESINSLFPNQENALYDKNSLSRALKLVELYGREILLRHQADWIVGWLMNNWTFGEEGNNLRLGWDLTNKKWPYNYERLTWFKSLPKVISSGHIIGNISREKSNLLGLSKDTLIVAGTTDANAAVIASGADLSDGITILGSTIVVKSFVNKPIKYDGITNHRIAGRWLTGGASNAGGKILRKYFNNDELIELSKQINPHKDSGLKFIPLTQKGERFPVNDPNLEPILKPRPISDCLFLHGILEGLARIETEGWLKLIKLGVTTPKRIITIGGGSKNPQWRIIRERYIKIPIKNSNKPPAYGTAIIAMDAIKKKKISDILKTQKSITNDYKPPNPKYKRKDMQAYE